MGFGLGWVPKFDEKPTQTNPSFPKKLGFKPKKTQKFLKFTQIFPKFFKEPKKRLK